MVGFPYRFTPKLYFKEVSLDDALPAAMNANTPLSHLFPIADSTYQKPSADDVIGCDRG